MKHVWELKCVALGASGLLAMSSPASPQNYTLTQITAGANTYVTATSLNASGQVGGSLYLGSAPTPHAFIWKANGFTYLPGFGAGGSRVTAIGPTNQAAGVSLDATSNLATYVTWQNSVPTVYSKVFEPVAFASNGDMAAVAASYGIVAIVYGGKQFVSYEPMSAYATVGGINSSDTVVGQLDGQSYDVGGIWGTIWQPDAMWSLVAQNANFLGINDRGTIVGSVSTGGIYYSAAMWSGPSLTQTLLPPLGGNTNSVATAVSINKYGAIVGSLGPDPIAGGYGRAVIWANGQVTDLTTAIQNGASLTLTLNNALAINDLGQILVSGVDPANHGGGYYVLNPVDESAGPATPMFSEPQRTYASAQQLLLSDATPGVSIYYTLDGTTPSESSTRYSMPIAVTASTTIKAIAVGTGNASSEVATGTYTIAIPTAPPPSASLAATNSLYATGSVLTPTVGLALDRYGNALDAALLGHSINWGGAEFTFGAPNTKTATSSATIALTPGHFANLKVLGLAVRGSTPHQAFSINYTDGSSQIVFRGVSDWASPQHYQGETVVVTMADRVAKPGTLSYGPFHLYGYDLPIDATKEVSSLTTPSDPRVIVLGVAQSNPPGQDNLVDLAKSFNVQGVYTATPPLGGRALDNYGNAYAEALLGTSLSWSGSLFQLGSADVLDAVTNATIDLPAGNFRTLKMLATAVDGNQSQQSFRITYTDGSSQTETQSMSDWKTPQSYAGESVALTMAYRLLPGGAESPNPYHLYGYTFALDVSKTVQSIALPPSRHVVAFAVTLSP